MKILRRNPWVPAKNMSGNKIDTSGILVLAILSWSFYKLLNIGYEFINRKFVGPIHQ